MDASIFYIWILWLVAIPLGPLIGWLFQNHWAHLDKFRRRTALALFAASMAIGLCTILTPWSLRGFWLEAINLVLAYISATCLAALALKKSPRSFPHDAARGIAVLVALFVYSSLFVNYWRSDLPDTEANLGNHLVLRRCSGGWAGIDWEGVAIVEQPAELPFLEKRLYSGHIGVAGDCDRTSIRVERDPQYHEIRVRCGRQNPYVFARVKIP